MPEKVGQELVPFGMLQMRRTKIEPIAVNQLDQWRIYAKRWQLYPETRVTEEGHRLGKGVEQLHLVCMGLRSNTAEPLPLGPCGVSLFTIFDGGNFIACDLEILESLIVAHIRNVHREMEKMVYNEQ